MRRRAVAARLPFLARPGLPDEAGFLQVAAQWGTSGGGSLYGAYWVDRPPLLISLFQIAADTGGLVAPRVLGGVAVVLVVLLTARAADRLAGATAARWTAVVAAAPFVALGLLATIEATQSPTRGTSTSPRP